MEPLDKKQSIYSERKESEKQEDIQPQSTSDKVSKVSISFFSHIKSGAKKIWKVFRSQFIGKTVNLFTSILKSIHIEYIRLNDQFAIHYTLAKLQSFLGKDFTLSNEDKKSLKILLKTRTFRKEILDLVRSAETTRGLSISSYLKGNRESHSREILMKSALAIQKLSEDAKDNEVKLANFITTTIRDKVDHRIMTQRATDIFLSAIGYYDAKVERYNNARDSTKTLKFKPNSVESKLQNEDFLLSDFRQPKTAIWYKSTFNREPNSQRFRLDFSYAQASSGRVDFNQSLNLDFIDSDKIDLVIEIFCMYINSAEGEGEANIETYKSQLNLNEEGYKLLLDRFETFGFDLNKNLTFSMMSIGDPKTRKILNWDHTYTSY